MIEDFENLPTLAPQFGVIKQVSYLVEDIDHAMRAWHELAGVSPFLIVRDARPLNNVYYRGEKASQPRVDIAFAYIDGMQLELVQQLDDTPSLYKEALDRNQSGLHHYAICVDNFSQAYRYAQQHGYVAAVDAGIDGLARMSYMENKELKLILEIVEWNSLTKPYFDGIESMSESVDQSQLLHEFKLQDLMSIGPLLKQLGKFTLNKLLGRVERTRSKDDS